MSVSYSKSMASCRGWAQSEHKVAVVFSVTLGQSMHAKEGSLVFTCRAHERHTALCVASRECQAPSLSDSHGMTSMTSMNCSMG